MLRWYFYVMFGVVALASLSMTWWSIYDLAVHNLSIPHVVAAMASLIFDIGAVYLSAMSIQYAKTEDSGVLTEIGAFFFIVLSVYIVSQHAVLSNYPVAGVVLFASAPIVLGVLLKATLQYLTRQQRRQAGRVTERLPSVGWLTWLRYGRQSWTLASVAMQGRIINAASRLDMPEDKYKIFGQVETVHVPSVVASETAVDNKINLSQTSLGTEDKSPEQLSQVSRQELTSADKPVLPVWLPNEPTMSLATLSRTCLDNGVLDIETMYRYAVLIKGQDVNKMSLSKALTRQRSKT